MDSHNNKHTNTNTTKHQHHQPTNSELLSSAKLLAQAAKAQISHDETQKLDKAKLGSAAGDLFEAASHYGKLEEKGYGKYVEKAEDYLHKNYHSHSSTTTGNSPPPTTTHNTSSHGGDSGSGGFGDYMKMAQGFMKK